ncbi:MAG: exodeoxyribonuclease V subunit gamma [Candidatus Dasytiphilus stammeri]
MFTVYHSNQLDVLTKLITYYIKKIPLSDPLYSEYIMVPSNKMAQWLKIALAEQLDIVANIKFKLPSNFIWEILLTLQPTLPTENFFNKSHITWKLMAILPKMLNKPEFEIFKRYLDSHQDKYKLFQLAKNLANIFDQYLVYRPDWLILWERNKLVNTLPWKTQKWQAPLWYALIKYTEKIGQPTWHIANLYHQLIQTLQQTKKLPSGLPKRIFISGMTILPPIYINILYEVSKYMDIHFMFTNPCRYYWSHIQHKYLDNLRIKDVYSLPNIATQHGNQFTNQMLLASWGKLGRDNLYLLSKIETQDIDAFVDIEANNLLHKLQHDLLEMEDHTILGLTPENLSNSYNKRLLDPKDHSVRIHICYSKQRELEVLQDQLIEMIARDSSLTPSDIIVMVTDINIYAPFIQAVFGNPPSEYYLPFTIYDRGACDAHPVIQAFLSLLRITEITYFSEEMLLILEVPSIAKKFNVNENDLCYLRNCMYESGNQWILEDDKIGNLPVGIRTKIIQFLLKLKKLQLLLKKSRVLNEWKPLCQELLNDFFIRCEDPDTEVVLNFIELQWQHLFSNGISYYPDKIPITLLIDELVNQLDQIDLLPISRSSIHFCSLISSFYIPPVKIVCLLGMNDSLYPRILIPRALNLMRHQPQCGDCNPRDEDRYFFLETLLSAQNQFYVSYVGRSVEDNKEILPSMLVSELIDYIAQNYCLQGTQTFDVDTSAKLVREHLQCIHTIFDIERFISYSQKNEKIKAHQTQYLKTTKIKSVINEINISQLLQFWQHPARAFFNMRLGVKFDWIKPIIPNIEPVVDCFNYYKMNKKLLNLLIKGNDTRHLLLAKSSVKLPLGAFGELLWHKQQVAMKELAQRIRQYYCPGVNQEINFTIAGVRLHGLLSHVQSDGLVRWRPAPLNFNDGLVLWLEHLIYCFINGAGNSRMFGKQNTQWHFMSLSTREATAWLTHFIQGYQSGICTPLLLLPKTGGAWLKSCFNEKTLSVSYDKDIQIKARQKLLQTWMGDQNRGENKDPYFKRLFRAMDESSIQKVIHHAKDWLLPLMLFNQKN